MTRSSGKRRKRRVAQSSGPREANVTVVAGIRGTGKSTFCKNMAMDSSGRILVILKSDTPKIWLPYRIIESTDYKGLRTFTGVRKIILDKEYRKDPKSKKKVMPRIHRNYRGGTLIFDDAKKYLKANAEACPPGFMDLVIDARHIGNDTYIVCHGPTQIPKGTFDYVDYCWLSRTVRLINPNDFPIDDPFGFFEMQKLVNSAFERVKKKTGRKWGHFKLLTLMETA